MVVHELVHDAGALEGAGALNGAVRLRTPLLEDHLVREFSPGRLTFPVPLRPMLLGHPTEAAPGINVQLHHGCADQWPILARGQLA